MLNVAALKLSAQYAALFVGSIAILSIAVIFYMNQTYGGDSLSDFHLTRTPPPAGDAAAAHTVEAAQDRLEQGLVILNGLLIIVIPVITYLLARATLKPIQESHEAQQQFVDNASHELRTPLQVITGELELAASKDRSPTEYKRAIAAGLAEAKNLTALVQNLLLMARGSDASVRQEFKPVMISDVIYRAVERTGRMAVDKGSKIDLKLAEGLVTIGSEILLTQMLINVCENAIKYSPRGETVMILSARREHDIVISVTDRGPGLAKAQRKHAFERFWRSENSTQQPGRGLGLAIVRQIADLHGGRVQLADPPNRAGLMVTITLRSA